MGEPVVRAAEPGDAPRVAALLAELGYPDNDADGVRRRLAAWADEPAGTVFVAEDDGRVVGAIAVAAIPYLEREGRWGRIVALVVAAECRGTGVGRRLVATAEDTARELGCVAMEVTSSLQRDGSHGFYRRLGYADQKDRSARYLKKLAPAPAE